MGVGGEGVGGGWVVSSVNRRRLSNVFPLYSTDYRFWSDNVQYSASNQFLYVKLKLTFQFQNSQLGIIPDTLSYFISFYLILAFSLLNIFVLVFKLDPQMILVLNLLDYWKTHSQEKAWKFFHISEHKMQKSKCYEFCVLLLKQKFVIMTKNSINGKL